MINKLDEQVKLNTLESLNVPGVFRYSAISIKTLTLANKLSCDYDVCTTVNILSKYNIIVEGIEVYNDKLKDMIRFMDEFTDIQQVYMIGNYFDNTKNYTKVKCLHTNATSLYLLNNFRNIRELMICDHGRPIKCIGKDFDWRNKIVLNNLTELYVNIKCNIQLEDLLKIGPKLTTVHVHVNDINNYGGLSDVEVVLKQKCTKHFVSLVGLVNNSTSHHNPHRLCIYLLSTIMGKYMDNVVSKYTNITTFSIMCYSKHVTTRNLERIQTIIDKYSQFIKLQSNNLHDLLLNAYKITCMWAISSLKEDGGNGIRLTEILNIR